MFNIHHYPAGYPVKAGRPDTLQFLLLMIMLHGQGEDSDEFVNEKKPATKAGKGSVPPLQECKYYLPLTLFIED